MKKLLSLAWDYMVPICFFLLAVDTYAGDPSTRVSKSFPLIPGEYKNQWALGLAGVGVVLAFAVHRHKKNASGDKE
jgi:hypothetical protein